MSVVPLHLPDGKGDYVILGRRDDGRNNKKWKPNQEREKDGFIGKLQASLTWHTQPLCEKKRKNKIQS